MEDARMAPAKVLGYEPKLCSMLTRGESFSAFTESGHEPLCLTVFFPPFLHARLRNYRSTASS